MKIKKKYILSIGFSLCMVCSTQAQHVSQVAEAFATGQKVNAKSSFATFSSAGSSLLLTLPKEYLNRDMMMSACVKSTTHYKYAEVGTRPRVLITYFVQEGDKVYLKQRASNIVGNDSDNKEKQSLADNNKDYFLASLPLYDNGNKTVTFDVTKLFLTDEVFSPFSPWFRKATTRYNKSFCRIETVKTFDDNFSVSTLMSFDVTPKGKESLDNSLCSAQLVISALLLPKDKMKPRLSDRRIGLFDKTLDQYDLNKSDLYGKVSYVERWNIQPKDWKAWKSGKIVEPTKHIVYYLDDQFPESWKEPLRKGILEWNEVFRSIGLKDVIVVKDYPKNDDEFDEDNLKYNCIRYIPTDRGGAQGPSWSDPRTGELYCADVYVWGSLADFALRTGYVQTAQACEEIRGGKMPEKMFADHLQCVINHEIGHTLGLAHNMAGSQAYTIEQLLNPEFVKKNGLSASTMDYIYFNYIVPPGRKDIPLSYTNLGPYDKNLLKYIYYPTDPSLTAEEDWKVVAKFIDEHEGDPRYRYGEQQWGTYYDPTVVNYDLSCEPLKAGSMGISNLKYVLCHMSQWLKGKEKTQLKEEIYKALVEQYKTLVKNNLYYVGGVKLNHVLNGSTNKSYEVLDYSSQKSAFNWVAKELLNCQWLNEKSVTQDFDATQEASTGVADFFADEIVKLYKKVEFANSLNTDKPYTLGDFTDNIFRVYFEQPATKSSDKTVARLQLSLAKKIAEAADNEHPAYFLLSKKIGAWASANADKATNADDKIRWTQLSMYSKK